MTTTHTIRLSAAKAVTGRWVKLARACKGLTQEDVAVALRASRAYVAAVESGRLPITLARLDDWARALHLSALSLARVAIGDLRHDAYADACHWCGRETRRPDGAIRPGPRGSYCTRRCERQARAHGKRGAA